MRGRRLFDMSMRDIEEAGEREFDRAEARYQRMLDEHDHHDDEDDYDPALESLGVYVDERIAEEDAVEQLGAARQMEAA